MIVDPPPAQSADQQHQPTYQRHDRQQHQPNGHGATPVVAVAAACRGFTPFDAEMGRVVALSQITGTSRNTTGRPEIWSMSTVRAAKSGLGRSMMLTRS